MKIKFATITGADDRTDINEMVRISKIHPSVEWGILFSPNPERKGTLRYPTLEWIKELDKSISNGKFHSKLPKLNLSAHICGGYSKEAVLTGNVSSLKSELRQPYFMFQRKQLNFNITKIENYDIFKFISWGLLDNNDTILQFNNANSSFISDFMDRFPTKDPAFLYDSSGGRGVVSKNWNGIIDNTQGKMYFTGYAGGLTPANLESELQKINAIVGDNEIWIDTETGVRTDDILDLEKVEQFLEIAKPYTL